MKRVKKIMVLLIVGMLLLSSAQVKTVEASDEVSDSLPMGRQWITGEDLGTAIVQSPKERSTIGSDVVITPGTYHSYGSWGTHEFTMNTETGTYLGFCAQPNKSWPSGTYRVSKLDNHVIEGLLLTYLIPDLWNTIGINFYTPGYEYVFCHAAIGYVYSGSLKGLSTQAANGIKTIVAELSNIMDGAGVYAGSKKTALLHQYLDRYELHVAYNDKQDIVWVEEIPNGYCNLLKVSSNPNMTNGNHCYSLEGAVYGIYSEAACTNKQAELVTNQNGNSNTVTLKNGTYYVKEISVPEGYAFDETVYPITISAGATETLYVQDAPKTYPVSILLEKVDAQTRTNIPIGTASLQNAEFTVKFYGILLEEPSVDPETIGYEPLRTWVFKTDENGFCTYNYENFVSGDALYFHSNGTPSLPIGTLTIQETKAPIGYHINSEIFVRQITPDSSETGVETYHQPIVLEKSLKVKVIKQSLDLEQTYFLPGAVFTHVKPDGSTEEATTDENGMLEFCGLQVGEHTICEKTPPEHFKQNYSEVDFTVTEDNRILFGRDVGMANVCVDEEDNGEIIFYDEMVWVSIQIQKTNEQGTLLTGAEFTLAEDENFETIVACEETVNGILSFENIKAGKTYYLKETKPPAGYRITDKKVYRVLFTYREGAGCLIQCTEDSDWTKGGTTEGSVFLKPGETFLNASVISDENEMTVAISIENELGRMLPNTGSSGTVWMLLIGTGFVFGSLTDLKRKNKRG